MSFKASDLEKKVEERTIRYRRMIDNLPDVPFPAGINSAAEYLASLVRKGVKYRYDVPSPEVQKRIQEEMNIILSNHFEKYFLIIWEMTAMCWKRGIMYSTYSDESNSSMVCYVLRITDIDPLEHNLYFEFFCNPERGLNPKINLVMSKNIIQHLRNIYGNDCVAMSVDKREWNGDISEGRLGLNIMISKDPICGHIPVYESPRGLACCRDGHEDIMGFNIPKADHWEKYASDAYGTFHNISRSDRKTMDQVKKDRTKIYSKYWFSDKVKKRLRDFSLKSFADLVVVEAILNISTDDLADNVLADIIKRQKKGYKPLFDGSDDLLGETYGMILFKEQFIQIVQLITGWDWGKADLLRRNMARKKADELEHQMPEFMESAVGFGLSREAANELFKTLYDSAVLLAPKAWCLGDAKNVWQESYLKAHYPHVLIAKK